MKYFTYFRCSTESQIEKNGLQMQKDVVYKYCAEHGITISGEFHDDGISGAEEMREGMLDLLSNLESGDRVIVQNTSRLWRGDFAKVFIQRQMMKLGADVISIENPSYTIYEKDPNNYLMNTLFEALDVWDKMQISMKLSKGRRAKAKSGGKSCGIAPIGYKWSGQEIIIDEENAQIVREMFDVFEKTHNLSAVQRHCNKHGYKTSRGNDFSVASIKKIIENDFYAGTVRFGGIVSNGTHTPLVDAKRFAKIHQGVA